jgi:Cu+-exporting ATPase
VIKEIERRAQGLNLPEPESSDDGLAGIDRVEAARVAFVILAATAVWFHVWEPFPHFSVIGVVATLVGGFPIFKEAVENALERRMTMELSMTSLSSLPFLLVKPLQL